jgi:hypothetical protein
MVVYNILKICNIRLHEDKFMQLAFVRKPTIATKRRKSILCAIERKSHPQGVIFKQISIIFDLK